jgi:hypothetical protein
MAEDRTPGAGVGCGIGGRAWVNSRSSPPREVPQTHLPAPADAGRDGLGDGD